MNNRIIALTLIVSSLAFLAACKSDSGSGSGGEDDTTAPTLGSAIGFSGTSATATAVSWGAASDDVTAQAGLQYKLVRASSSADIDTADEANAIVGPGLVRDWTAGATTAPASGLSASTAYWFAVLVRDAAGNMSLYAPASVTTSATADTTAPTIGAAIDFSSTTSTGTTASWGAATDDVTAQASLQYKLVRASSSSAIDTAGEIDAITTAGAGLVMDWTAAAISKAVTSLTDSTSYYFAVIVRDAAGNKSVYAPVMVTTTDATSPSPGTAISFSGTTATGTTVNWGAATDNVTAQASLQYKLVRASSSSAIDSVSEIDAITTAGAGLVMDWTAAAISRAVTGLTDSTSYYFAVMASDAAGNKSVYAPASVTTTDATAPATGTAIGFSATTATGTTVSWGAATDNMTAQASLQYKLVRASSSSAIDTVAKIDAITTMGTGLVMDWTANTISKAVSGLTESTTHYFAAMVRDAAGNKSVYSPLPVTTLPPAADPAAQYRFENNANDSAGSYNLTAAGTPTYPTDRKEGSNSAYFDGASDLHNTGVSIGIPSGVTVSAWIRLDSGVVVADINPTIFGITGSNGAPTPTYNSWSLFLNAPNSIQIWEGNTTPMYSATINAATWYHVILTVDTSRNATVYLNGTSLGTQALGSDRGIATITQIYVGSDQGSYQWRGNADDFRVYAKVLSAAEIAALYGSY
jgi:hypothetical protein